MTLVQLEYTLAVAEYKNFTIAAEKCFVTQPTLSMQIQKLENELGVEIFDRSTHPITITTIGEKILKQAQKIVGESKKIQQMVQENQHSMEGTIHMGIIPTILPTFLPLFYKNFSKKYPKLHLHIKELKTEEIVTQLNEGTLDFGIAATPLYQDNIIEKPLYYEPLVAFVPEESELSRKKKLQIADLSQENMLILEEGHCFRNNVLNICDKDMLKERKVQLDSGSFQALINLSKDGFGMTLLPLLHTENLSKDDEKFIRTFEDPAPTREISLIYENSQIRTSFAQHFVDLIQGIIRGKLYLESDNITSPKLTIG